MRKLVLISILTLFFFGGCSGIYLAKLEMVYPETPNDLLFADENIQIAFAPYVTESLNCKLKNLQGDNIEIIWPEARITDSQGIVFDLVLLGEEEPGPELKTQPRTIDPGEIIEERLVPRDNIYYNVETRQWSLLHIVPTETSSLSYVRSLEGEKIELLLPVKAGDEVYEYHFQFTIDLQLWGQPDLPPRF